MSEKRTIVKRVKNGVLFSDDSIRIDNVRLSYPHLAEPQENTNDAGKVTKSYGVVSLAPKATHREIKDLIVAQINGVLAEKKIKVAADRKFIKDGDAMAKEECEGMWVINARESKRPSLRGRFKDPATGKPKRLTPEEAASIFYGGCYGSVLIRPWVQDNDYGKRINANLLAVQFQKDGPAFGEGRISDDDIDDRFEGEEDDGGFDEADADDL